MRQSACVYELKSPHSGGTPPDLAQQEEAMVTRAYEHDSTTTSASSDDEFSILGYGNKTAGTPGILRSLVEPPSLCGSRTRHKPATSQYASTLRELPSPRHIDILVQAFFQNVAWHYDIVDEATFAGQLRRWSNLSHHQLRTAPQSLPEKLQAFPALLFQVLAQALLFQPKRHDKNLDDLKYAADMELSDRAAEYSEAGHHIASSFGKTELDLSIVQATLMRACFQKTTGAVTEAWHTLGTAIRDAQELGLHKLEPERSLSWRTETSYHALGRKIWLVLHLWDAHMGIVLGRPISTRISPQNVPTPTPWNCSLDAPRQPLPRDIILCGYHTAYKYLQDIHDLEKISSSHTLVDSINEQLLTNISNLPEWARAQSPRECEPAWLPAALEIMNTNIYFVLFALHRPFIFASASSRRSAVYAATKILESQARLFDQTEPLQHKAFSWIFATFDALVVLSAVHVRFPEEFDESSIATKTIVEGALERLKFLRSTNELAGSAYRVVSRLYEKIFVAAAPSTESSGMVTVDGNSFTGMEADMLVGEWDDASLADLGSYLLPPEPFNELLCNGDASFCTDQAWQADLGHVQLGVLDGL